MDIEALNQKMFAGAAEYLNDSRKGFREEYSAFIRNNTNLKEGARVLDVGCGLGFLAKTIEKFMKSLEIHGIDCSPELIEKAKEDSTIQFITGDTYNLPYPESFFDLTICQTLFMHLANPERALEEMVRVTKPSGQITAIEPIIHTDGLDRFVPGEASIKVEERKKLTAFDIEKKKEGGIDMFIARKLPYFFLSKGLSDVRVSAHTFVFLSLGESINDRKEKSSEQTNFSSYEMMMLQLGYPKDELEKLLCYEKKFANVPGELSLTTLLLISGKKSA